jgi:hypothetical protein
MGNDVGESIWDSHPVVKADAAKGKISKAVESAIVKKYPGTGQYNIDKARGEGRGLVSAARDARTSAAGVAERDARNVRNETLAIQKNSVKVVPPTRTSGLKGVSGKLGGQHAGGHGASLGGGIESNFGGGGLNEVNK